MKKIAKTLLKKLFYPALGRCRRRVPASRAWPSLPLEMLEKRLAMAVDIGFRSPAVTNGAENWLTVIANEGSDVFMQQVATPTSDLYIADNGAFSDRYEVAGVDSLVDSVYVYNGVLVGRSVDYANGTGVPLGYPWLGGSQADQELRFLLPSEAIDFREPILGTIDLQDGSSNRVIEFDQDSPGNFSILSGPGAGGLLSYRLEASQGLLEIVFDGGGLFGSAPGVTGTPELSITYDTDTDYFFNGFVSDPSDQNFITHTVASSVPRAENPVSEYLVLDTTMHKYVPGTLRGQVELGYDGGTTVGWQVDESGYGEVAGVAPELWSVPVSFTDAREQNHIITTVEVFDNEGRGFIRDVIISGRFFTTTGVLQLETNFDGTNTGFAGGVGPRASALTLPEFVMAVRDVDEADQADDPLDLLFDRSPNSYTLVAGQDFTRGLEVEFPNALSSVSIKSPLLATDEVHGRVSFAATTVDVMAPLRAAVSFQVPSADPSPSDNGTIFGTTTESVRVDAVLSTPSVEISVSDLPETGSYGRSQVLITQGGVIANMTDALATPPVSPAQAEQVYMEIVDGDIFVEGRIAAERQSYVMASDIGSEVEAPYTFTTRSRLTGVDTGRISGDVLSINLVNDTFGEDFKAFQTLLNDLSISTDVDRLRATAGSRLGQQSAWPFPYTLAVRNASDLSVDAVAASSGPITIESSGSLDLLATVRSFGDVSFQSEEEFRVNAPVLTAFGQITMKGPQITVANAVQVLDAIPDERKVDISIEATDGPLVVEDAVSGINRVEIKSLGAAANISGNARVVADIVDVAADGDVEIRTEANLVTVVAPGSVKVDELTAASFVVRNAPDVTLVANGRDAVVGETEKQLSPALLADIYDTTKLVISAPNGSIDVLHYGSEQLQIGDGGAIRQFGNGTSDDAPVEALAAGSVIVRSEYGRNVLIHDTARPTSGAEAVRFVTTEKLPLLGSEFVPSTAPGIYPTILRVKLPLGQGNTVPSLDGAVAEDIRLGDKILVKEGLGGLGGVDQNIVNGVYVVRQLRYEGAGDAVTNGAKFVQLTLNRSTSWDTSDDLAERHYVRVVDGGALVGSEERGAVYVSNGYTNNAPGEGVATPLVVTPVPSQPGFVVATAVTTRLLDAQYNDNEQKIISNQAVSIGSLPEFFDGVTLGEGSRVLVREAVGGDASAIGLYQVSEEGFDGSDNWVLTRVGGIDEDGDGVFDPVYTGIVAVNQGFLRTALTGEMFRVSYESINNSPLTYQEITNFRAEEDYSKAPFDPLRQFRLDIGTNNPIGIVTFEVSGEGGTNDSAGSLGKMISLANDNTAVIDRVGIHPYAFAVNSQVNRIDLEQELPQIRVPITIDGNDNLIINGSGITKTRDGSIVRGISFGSRVGPVRPSQQATARRLVRNGGNAELTELDGFTVSPSAGKLKLTAGSGAALTTVIRDLSIGGFANGAAVRIVGADNVLVENLDIGSETSGRQLPNKYGVQVSNSMGGKAGKFTTVLDTSIVGSSVAGVQLDNNASGVRVIQSEIGRENRPNATGVQFASDLGHNFLGSMSVAPAEGSEFQDVFPVDFVGPPVDLVCSLARTEATVRLRPGVEFYDEESETSWFLKKLDLDVDADGNEQLLATLDGRNFTFAETQSGFAANVGYFTQATARSREIRVYDPEKIVTGVDANGDPVTNVGQRLRDLLFVGQPVESVNRDVLVAGTRIVAIEEVGDDILLELSEPAELSARTALRFDGPLRNSISYNQYGVKLKSGSSNIRNTDIAFSIFDGLRLEGVGVPGDVSSDGKHVIGDAGAFGELYEENVSIHSNGLTGIVIPDEFFAAIVGAGGGLPEKIKYFHDHVVVAGNYLGTDIDKNDGLTNGLDGESNIGFEDGSLQHELADKVGAVFRPEENPNDDPSLVERVGLDFFNNYHVEGEMDTSDSDFGDGGMVSPPPRRRLTS